MGHSLFIVAGRSVRLRLDKHHGLLHSIFALFTFGVDGESLLEGLHRLVVLLLKLMAGGFASPTFHELRVKFQSLLCILHAANRLHKLNVGK